MLYLYVSIAFLARKVKDMARVFRRNLLDERYANSHLNVSPPGSFTQGSGLRRLNQEFLLNGLPENIPTPSFFPYSFDDIVIQQRV
jgi:hypothetical protein